MFIFHFCLSIIFLIGLVGLVIDFIWFDTAVEVVDTAVFNWVSELIR